MGKIIQLVLVFAAFVAPLGAKALAIHTPFGEFSLFRISIFAGFILMIFDNGGKIKVYFKPQNRYCSYYFLFFLLYSVISVVWSKSIDDWFRSVFFLVVAVLAIILYSSYFRERKQIIYPLKALCFGILIQSLIGWFEVFTRVYIFKPEAILTRPVINQLGVPVAMQFNSNNFALMMFFGTFIAMINMTYSERFKALYFTVGVSYVVLAFLTGSRAITLAYLLAAAFILTRKGKARTVIVIILLALFIAIPQTVSFIQNTLQFRFSENTGSDYVRMNLIRNGLYFLLQTYGFGVGAGQIQYWMRENAVYYTGSILAMHNWWLELLTSNGIIIFAGYTAFYIKLFKLYSFENRIKKKSMGLFICSILVGFIIGGVGPSSTMSLEWLWLFWGISIAGLNSSDAPVSLCKETQI